MKAFDEFIVEMIESTFKDRRDILSVARILLFTAEQISQIREENLRLKTAVVALAGEVQATRDNLIGSLCFVPISGERYTLDGARPEDLESISAMDAVLEMALPWIDWDPKEMPIYGETA
jgi:hypothetical protein